MLRSVHPHAQRLERWLGVAEVQAVSAAMRDWYGPPIAVAGAPGKIFVHKGGDFSGEFRVGAELSGFERGVDLLKRYERRRFARMFASQRGSFSSLSALIAAATGGKQVIMTFQKTGTAPTAIGGSMDMWTNTGQPAAGAAGAAAPGGTSPTNSTTGNLGYVNAVANANTGHFVNAGLVANFVNSLLLYDRLLSVAKTMASTGTEAVTGTFSRYQNGTATAVDYIGGNFMFPSNPTTILAATGHNWTVCQYTNQASTTGKSAPSATGISACAVHQIDLAVGPGSWFMPLASGDVGVKALTQMQCSASVATGTIDFVVGHPIAFLPVPLVNIVCNIDGVASAFNLVTVFDNACLALIEMPKPATNATTYSGQVTTVSE